MQKGTATDPTELPPLHILFFLFWPGVYIFSWPFIGTYLLARHYQRPLIPFILEALLAKPCTTPQLTYIKPKKRTHKQHKKRRRRRGGRP
jgi:hypothetical protein